MSKAVVQIGIYKKNSKNFKPMSRLVFRQGLFHSLKAKSKTGLYALEFETPYNKKDLVRLKDNYKEKKIWGKEFTRNLDSEKIKFTKPVLEKRNIYRFNNMQIILEKTLDIEKLSSADESSLAILDGSLKDKNGVKVITYGEIIKTSTLKILSKHFKIKKPLVILRVNKIKKKQPKDYKLNNASRYSYLRQQFSNCNDLWKKLKKFVSTEDFTLGKELKDLKKILLNW